MPPRPTDPVDEPLHAVGELVDGGIEAPDHPADPDRPENRGRPAAEDAVGPPDLGHARAPLRSLRWVESLLRALHTNGFSSVQTVVAYRAHTSFLLGHLLLEVARRGVAINAVDDPDGSPAATPLDLAEFPLITELQPLLSLDETLAEFEESLESLLDRLQTMIETGAHHLPPVTADATAAELPQTGM